MLLETSKETLLNKELAIQPTMLDRLLLLGHR
jgi:hypothetical protein